jgi:hypothetical protein
MSLIVWGVLTPDQINSTQAQLLADAQGVDAQVQSCAALDSGTKTAWNSFYAQLQTFCKQQVVWFFAWGANEVPVTRGRAFEVENQYRSLVAWKQALSKACSIAASNFDPTASDPADPNLNAIALYGGIAITAVAGAYVVGQVASLLRARRG